MICSVFPISCKENENEKNIEKNATSFFRLIPPAESGINFENSVEEKSETFFEHFQYVYNGSGVAAGDINNDGLVDLFFGANENPNRLYLNQGNLRFTDITIKSATNGSPGWTNGVSMVDINGDGLLDIYICKGGWNDSLTQRRNELYINKGDLVFSEEGQKYGVADSGYSTQAVFFDLDNDNDLDMYLINRPAKFGLSISEYKTGEALESEDNRDKLYINNGGVFTEEGKSRGITNNFGHSLGVAAADLNGDGFADIYVANDFEAKDLLYLNQGDGSFSESINKATNHISYSSMGMDIADLNNDGFEDIVVMEMQSQDYVRSKTSMPQMNVPRFKEMVNSGMHKQFMHNTLLQNHGNGFFSDIAYYAGIAKTDWSWSTLASDLDNDGLRDLVITNGLKRDIIDRDAPSRIEAHVPSMKQRYAGPQQAMTEGLHEIIGLFPEVRLTNFIYKNMGGLSYKDVSKEWGFTEKSFSHGAAIADFDNDGDLDIAINNLENPAYLFENTTGNNKSFLRLELKGPKGNQHGLGAKIWIYYDQKLQYFQQKIARGYLSSSEPTIHFGLDKSVKVDSLKIIWPDGRAQVLDNLDTNQKYTLSYTDSSKDHITSPKRDQPFYSEKSKQMMKPVFVHSENSFDEYAKQVLLPHEFSQNGPFVAVGDVNDDGFEDFFVGGATSQTARLYFQNRTGFESSIQPLFREDSEFEDMGAELADMDGDGDLDLVVSSGGGQYPEGSKKYFTRIYYNSGKGRFTERVFLPSKSSSACLAIDDFDRDGDADIFVGGQIIGGAYAKSPQSHLFVNEGNQFIDRTKSLAPMLERIGMVNAARWVDLYGTDSKELVLAGEWMPIKVFSFENGRFDDISSDLGLSNTEGWWNTIAAEDLDQDGDIDLVLGNLGHNYKFKASPDQPFEVFAGDFDNNGSHDVFLAKSYQNRKVPIRGKDCSAQQLPSVAERFTSFRSFAEADIHQVIGSNFDSAIHLKSYLFSSVVLDNKKDHFEIRPLPKEAQFSTVNTIESFDYDSDGILDLIIAGNRFGVEIETTPADASIGYVFRGKGDLNFELVSLENSGFFVPYDVKDAKIVNVGGVKHILVAENNGLLRIFGKP